MALTDTELLALSCRRFISRLCSDNIIILEACWVYGAHTTCSGPQPSGRPLRGSVPWRYLSEVHLLSRAARVGGSRFSKVGRSFCACSFSQSHKTSFATKSLLKQLLPRQACCVVHSDRQSQTRQLVDSVSHSAYRQMTVSAAKPGTADEGLGVVKGGWFTELGSMWPGQGLSIQVTDVLFKERSLFQVGFASNRHVARTMRGPDHMLSSAIKQQQS